MTRNDQVTIGRLHLLSAQGGLRTLENPGGGGDKIAWKSRGEGDKIAWKSRGRSDQIFSAEVVSALAFHL